jgi:hypothetical protein
MAAGVGIAQTRKTMEPTQIFDAIERLARSRRVALLEYHKAGQVGPTRRTVEPYSVESNGADLMVRCWQIDPPTSESDGWRVLRMDRIVAVYDGGADFTPRAPVTLGGQPLSPFFDGRPISSDPAAKYHTYVQSCLLDGRLSEDEIDGALSLSSTLDADQVRAVHARLFAAALQEAALDDMVSADDAAYLAGLHRFLQVLGWAPGGANAGVFGR